MNKRKMNSTLIADPMASRTGWSMLSNGNFRSRHKKLVVLDASRVAIMPTVGMLALYATPGLITCLVWLISKDSIAGLAPVFFGGVVVYFLRQFALPSIFDKKTGRFVNAWVGTDEGDPWKVSGRSGYLKDIYAIQVLNKNLPKKTRRSGIGSNRYNSISGGFHEYEINLVLNDAMRLHVVGHGDKPKLLMDAEALAAFLGKPLWIAPEESSFGKVAISR